MKKMKKIFIVLYFFTALIIFTACGAEPAPSVEPETQVPAISFAEYKAMVLNFNLKIVNEADILLNVGTFEHNYWQAYSNISSAADTFYNSTVDYDAMVEAAMEWLSEKSEFDAETVAAAYDELITTYVAISEAHVDREISTKTTELIDALFGAYHQLYKTVTEPSGTIENLAHTLDESEDAIKLFSSELLTILKD